MSLVDIIMQIDFRKDFNSSKAIDIHVIIGFDQVTKDKSIDFQIFTVLVKHAIDKHLNLFKIRLHMGLSIQLAIINFQDIIVVAIAIIQVVHIAFQDYL